MNQLLAIINHNKEFSRQQLVFAQPIFLALMFQYHRFYRMFSIVCVCLSVPFMSVYNQYTHQFVIIH